MNIETVAIVAVICLFLVAVSAFFTWRRADAAFTWAEAAFKYAQDHSAEEISRKALAELRTELDDLGESYDQLLQGHKKLRSRVGMREVRARRSVQIGDDDEVDLSNGRDKTQLRLEAKRQGLLK